MDDNIMADFRHAYGRLCRMSAEAIHHNYHRQAVWLASTGRSHAQSRTLQAISRQASRVDIVVGAARKVGFKPEDFVRDMLDVRSIIQGEWCLELPVESESESVS